MLSHIMDWAQSDAVTCTHALKRTIKSNKIYVLVYDIPYDDGVTSSVLKIIHRSPYIT